MEGLEVGSVIWTAKLDVSTIKTKIAEMEKTLRKVDTTIKLDARKLPSPILKTKLAVDDTNLKQFINGIEKKETEVSVKTNLDQEIKQPELADIENPAVDLSTIIDQFDAINKKIILPVVDHKPLDELNKHLDLKQAHWDELNGHMVKNPLRPNTDTGGASMALQELDSELSDAMSKFEMPIALTQDTEVKQLEAVEKESKNLTQADAIADIITELSQPDRLTTDNDKTRKPKDETKKEDKKILAASLLVPTVVTGVMRKELTGFFNTQHKLSARQLNVIGFFQKAVTSFGLSSDKFAKANRSSFFGSIFKGVTNYMGQSLGEYLILKVGPKLAEKGAEALVGEKAGGLMKRVVPFVAEKGTDMAITEKLPTKQLESVLIGTFAVGRSLEMLTGSLAERDNVMSGFFKEANSHLSQMDSVVFSTYRQVKTAELIHHALKEIKKSIIYGLSRQAGIAVGKSVVGTVNKVITGPPKALAGALMDMGKVLANLTLIPFKKVYDRVRNGQTNQERIQQGSRLGYITGALFKGLPTLLMRGGKSAVGFSINNPVSSLIGTVFKAILSPFPKLFDAIKARLPRFQPRTEQPSWMVGIGNWVAGIAQKIKGDGNNKFLTIPAKFISVTSNLLKGTTTFAGIGTRLMDRAERLADELTSTSLAEVTEQVENDTPVTVEDILKNIFTEVTQIKTLMGGQGVIGTTENNNSPLNPINNLPITAPITSQTIGRALIPIINLLRLSGTRTRGEKAKDGGVNLLATKIKDINPNLTIDFKREDGTRKVKSELQADLQNIISDLADNDQIDELNKIADFIVKNWEKLALDIHSNYGPDLGGGGMTSTRLNSSNVNTEGLEESAEASSEKWVDTGDDIVATLNRLLAVSETVGNKLTSNLAENSPGPTRKIRLLWFKTADYLIKQMVRLVAPSKKVGEFLANSFSNAFVNIGKTITDIESRIKRIKFGNLFESSKNFVGNIGETIGDKANAIKNNIGEKATAVKKNVTDKIELPDLGTIKEEVSTQLDNLKSFDINSVLGNAINTFSESVNKIFSGINTELQKIEFKKPLSVINKTLQSFYGHIITQVKSYKSVFKSFNDSLIISESTNNETKKVKEENSTKENITEDTQNKSTELKVNSFDINSVLGNAISKISETINKLFSGINTELGKIKYQEPLRVINKTLITLYGFVINQIKKYKTFFKSFVDSIDLGTAITQNKITIKEHIIEFQSLVSINIVELFRNVNSILKKITTPLTDIIAIADEIYSNLIDIKTKMSALATKMSAFDFSFDNIVETLAKSLNVAFKDSDKSWAKIVKLLTKSAYVFVKQGALLLGPVLFAVIKEVADTLKDTIQQEILSINEKFKIMDKINNSPIIITLIKNINRTILFLTKSIGNIRYGIETSTTLFYGIFALVEDKVKTTGDVINKSLQNLVDLFNNLKDKLNSIPFLKSKDKPSEQENNQALKSADIENTAKISSDKTVEKAETDDTKQEEIYFRKLFIALNKAILSLDRKGTKHIAKLANIPLTSTQSRDDLLPLLIDKIALNPSALKEVITEIESSWDDISLSGDKNPFSELHSEIDEIDDRWGETGNFFKKVVREMSAVSKKEGYKILHNLAEGSPGLTQDIRNRWRETTKDVGRSMQGMTKESTKSFQALTDVMNGVKITGLDFGSDLASNLKAKLGDFANEMIDRGEVKLYDLLGINLKDTTDVDKAIGNLNTQFSRLKIMGATDVDSVMNSFGSVLNRRENASFKQVRQQVKEISAIKKEIAAKLETPPTFKKQDGTLDKRAIVKYFQEVEKLMSRYKVTLGNVTQNFKVNPNVQKALNTLPLEAHRNLNSFIDSATKGFKDFETMADSFQDSMVNILNLDSDSLRNLKVPESVIAQIEKLALVGKEARVALDFDNFQMPTFEENKQQATRTLVNIYDKKARVDDIKTSRTENVGKKTTLLTDMRSVKAKYDSDYKRLIAQNKITEAKTLEDGYKSYITMRAKQLQDIKNVESKYSEELGDIAILLGDFDTEAQVADYLAGFDTLADGLDSLADKIQTANEELKQSTIETANSITSNLSIYEASTQEILAIEAKLQSIGKQKENVETKYTTWKYKAKAKEKFDLNEIIKLEQKRLAEIRKLESAESDLTASLEQQKNIKETSRKKVFEIQQSGSLADINSIYETEVPEVEPEAISGFDRLKAVLTEVKKLAGSVFSNLSSQFDTLKTKFPILRGLENLFKNMGLQIGVLTFLAPIGFNLLSKAITASVQAITQKIQELFRISFQAALDFESQINQFKFTFGQVKGLEQFTAIRKQSDDLGQSVKNTSQQFSQFALGLQGVQMEDSALTMFEGIQKGLTVRGVDAEATGRALVALTQIANKGKVSMEELSGQLGEALPGAIPLAAKAFNMDTSQLIAEVSAGKVMPDEFLPRLTTEMSKQADPYMEGALDTGAVKITKLGNAINDLQVLAGGVMLDFTKPLIIGLTNGIKVIADLGSALGKLAISLSLTFAFPLIIQGFKTLWLLATKVFADISLAILKLRGVGIAAMIDNEMGLKGLQLRGIGVMAQLRAGFKGFVSIVTIGIAGLKTAFATFAPFLAISLGVDIASKWFTVLNQHSESVKQTAGSYERMAAALAKVNEEEAERRGENPTPTKTTPNLPRGIGEDFGQQPDELGRGKLFGIFKTGEMSWEESNSINKSRKMYEEFSVIQKEQDMMMDTVNKKGGIDSYLEQTRKIQEEISFNASVIGGLKGNPTIQAREKSKVLREENRDKTDQIKTIYKDFFPASTIEGLTEKFTQRKAEADKEVLAGNDYLGQFANLSTYYENEINKLKNLSEDMADALKDGNFGLLTLTQSLVKFNAGIEAGKLALAKQISIDKQRVVQNQLKTGYSDALVYQRKNADLEVTNAQKESKRLQDEYNDSTKLFNETTDKKTTDSLLAIFQQLGDKATKLIDIKPATLNDAEDKTSTDEQKSAITGLKRRYENRNEYEASQLQELTSQLALKDLGKQQFIDIRSFLRGLEEFDITVRDYFRDRARTLYDTRIRLEDASIQNARGERDLVESYQDLVTSLNTQLLTTANEITRITSELKRRTSINQLRAGLDFGQKGFLADFITLFEGISTSETDVRNETLGLDEQRLAIATEMVGIAKQIRGLEEQVFDLARQRKAQEEELTRQFDDFQQSQTAAWRAIQNQSQDMVISAKSMGVNFEGIADSISNINANYVDIHNNISKLAESVRSSVEQYQGQMESGGGYTGSDGETSDIGGGLDITAKVENIAKGEVDKVSTMAQREAFMMDVLMKEHQMPKEMAAAIVGVIRQESKADPYNVNPSSGAYGLVQWLGDRKVDFDKNVKLTRNVATDIRSELGFLVKEIKGKEAGNWGEVKKQSTLDGYALAFRKHIVRPNPKTEGKNPNYVIFPREVLADYNARLANPPATTTNTNTEKSSSGSEKGTQGNNGIGFTTSVPQYDQSKDLFTNIFVNKKKNLIEKTRDSLAYGNVKTEDKKATEGIIEAIKIGVLRLDYNSDKKAIIGAKYDMEVFNGLDEKSKTRANILEGLPILNTLTSSKVLETKDELNALSRVINGAVILNQNASAKYHYIGQSEKPLPKVNNIQKPQQKTSTVPALPNEQPKSIFTKEDEAKLFKNRNNLGGNQNKIEVLLKAIQAKEIKFIYDEQTQRIKDIHNDINGNETVLKNNGVEKIIDSMRDRDGDFQIDKLEKLLKSGLPKNNKQSNLPQSNLIASNNLTGIIPTQPQVKPIVPITDTMNWLEKGLGKIEVNKPEWFNDLNVTLPEKKEVAQLFAGVPILNKPKANQTAPTILLDKGHADGKTGTNGTFKGAINGKTLEAQALEILTPILAKILNEMGVPTQLFESNKTNITTRSDEFINQAKTQNAIPLQIHLDQLNGEDGVMLGTDGKRTPFTNALQDRYGLNKFNDTRSGLAIPKRGGTLLELGAMTKEVTDMFVRAIKSGDYTEIEKWARQHALSIKEAYLLVNKANQTAPKQTKQNTQNVANNQSRIVPVSIVAGVNDSANENGTSTGSHLHLAALKNGSYINPSEYEKYIQADGKPLRSNPSNMRYDFGMREHPVHGGQKMHNGKDWDTRDGAVLSVDTSRLKPIGFKYIDGYGGVTEFEDVLTGVIVRFAHQAKKSEQLMNQAGAGGFNLPNVPNGFNGIQGGQTAWNANKISQIGYNPNDVSQVGKPIMTFTEASYLLEQIQKKVKFSDNEEGVAALAELIQLKDEGRFEELADKAKLLGIDLEQLKIYKVQLEAQNQIQKAIATRLENEVKMYDFVTQIVDASRQMEDTWYGLNNQLKEFSLNAKGYLTFGEETTRQFDALSNKVRDTKRALDDFEKTMNTNLGFTEDMTPEQRQQKETEAIPAIKEAVTTAVNEQRISEEAAIRLLTILETQTLTATEKIKLFDEDIKQGRIQLELSEEIEKNTIATNRAYEGRLEIMKGLSQYSRIIAEFDNKKNPYNVKGLRETAVMDEMIRQEEELKALDDLAKKHPEYAEAINKSKEALIELNKTKLEDVSRETSLFFKGFAEPMKTAIGDMLGGFIRGEKSFNDIAKGFLDSIANFFIQMTTDILSNQAIKLLANLFEGNFIGEYLGLKNINNVRQDVTGESISPIASLAGLGIQQFSQPYNNEGYSPATTTGNLYDFSQVESLSLSLSDGLVSAFGDVGNILDDSALNQQSIFTQLFSILGSGGSTGGGGFLGGLLDAGLNMAVGAIGGGISGGITSGGGDLLNASLPTDFIPTPDIGSLTFSGVSDIKAFKDGGMIKAQDIPNFNMGGIVENIPNFKMGGIVEKIDNFKEGGTIGRMPKIGNFKEGGKITKIPKIDTFAKGGAVKNNLESMVNLSLGISKAMKKEGANAVPAVLSINEEVLRYTNGDADYFRVLEKSGVWESMKSDYKYNRSIPNYLNGGSIGNPSTNMMNHSNSNTTVNNISNVTVKATDVNSFRKSSSLIAQEQKIAQARANNYT